MGSEILHCDLHGDQLCGAWPQVYRLHTSLATCDCVLHALILQTHDSLGLELHAKSMQVQQKGFRFEFFVVVWILPWRCDVVRWLLSDTALGGRGDGRRCLSH